MKLFLVITTLGVTIFLAGCKSSQPPPTEPAIHQITEPVEALLVNSPSPLSPTLINSSLSTSTSVPSITPQVTSTNGKPSETPTPTPQFPSWFTPFPPSSIQDSALVYPELTRQPLPEIVEGDSGNHTDVFTWLDLNGDGIYEPDEPPISGIHIYLDEEYDNLRNDPQMPWQTNSLGWETVNRGSHPAGISSYYPEIPQNYRLTTPEFQVVGPEYINAVNFVPFGFAPLSGTITSIPTERESKCEIVWEVSNWFAMASDGSLWTVMENGTNDMLARRDPQTRLWQLQDIPSKLSTLEFNGITFGSSGKIFLNSYDGVLVYDGSSFEPITQENGLPDDYILSTVELEDGSYLIVTENGLSRFNPRSNTIDNWTFCDLMPDQANASGFFFPELGASPDGSLWLVDTYGSTILNFIPDLQGTGFTNFQIFDREAGEGVIEHPFKAEFSGFREFAFESSGKIWFTYKARLYSYDRQNNEFILYRPPDSLDDPMPDYDWFSSVAVGPDGSIWTSADTSSEPLIYRLLPDRQTWQAYTKDNGLPDGDRIWGDLMVSPDGAVWYSFEDRTLRCELND